MKYSGESCGRRVDSCLLPGRKGAATLRVTRKSRGQTGGVPRRFVPLTQSNRSLHQPISGAGGSLTSLSSSNEYRWSSRSITGARTLAVSDPEGAGDSHVAVRRRQDVRDVERLTFICEPLHVRKHCPLRDATSSGDLCKVQALACKLQGKCVGLAERTTGGSRVISANAGSPLPGPRSCRRDPSPHAPG